MKVLLDCDGVLLDWESAFREWVTTKLRRPIAAQPTDWCLSKWLGVTKEESSALVEEFNAGEHFSRLRPLPGAVWAIYELAASGYEMHVITSCAANPKIAARRRENLADHFGGVFASVTCLDLGQSKVKALVQHDPGAIWIEDNFNHALTGHALGHRTYVLRYPHNQKHEHGSSGLTWCDNWPEIVTHVVLGSPPSSHAAMSR